MPSRKGTIYLLHFSEPFKHARHYLGWTEDLAERLERHKQGNGSRLVQVITEAGLDFVVSRTWKGTRSRERALKRQGGASRLCPVCRSIDLVARALAGEEVGCEVIELDGEGGPPAAPARKVRRRRLKKHDGQDDETAAPRPAGTQAAAAGQGPDVRGAAGGGDPAAA